MHAIVRYGSRDFCSMDCFHAGPREFKSRTVLKAPPPPEDEPEVLEADAEFEADAETDG